MTFSATLFRKVWLQFHCLSRRKTQHLRHRKFHWGSDFISLDLINNKFNQMFERRKISTSYRWRRVFTVSYVTRDLNYGKWQLRASLQQWRFWNAMFTLIACYSKREWFFPIHAVLNIGAALQCQYLGLDRYTHWWKDVGRVNICFLAGSKFGMDRVREEIEGRAG